MGAEEIVQAVKSGDTQEIESSVHAALADKISSTIDEKRQEMGQTMFQEEQQTWKIEVPGEGTATVKGANESQAIDRALSKLNVSKEFRNEYKGKKKKDLKIVKLDEAKNDSLSRKLAKILTWDENTPKEMQNKIRNMSDLELKKLAGKANEAPVSGSSRDAQIKIINQELKRRKNLN